jgi:MinD superfamily P-loop ATPase
MNLFEDSDLLSDNGLDIQETAKKVSKEIILELSGRGNVSVKPIINNLVAFMSSSSGAGASTLVANVARLIEKKGLSVAVVDLNIMFPSQHLYYKIPQELDRSDLCSLLLGKTDLGESIYYSGNTAVILANNRGTMDYINLDEERYCETIDNALSNLSYQFDMVLVDCPLEITNAIVNTSLFKVDNIYMVMDDGVQSIVNLTKIRNALDTFGIGWGKVRFVMNKRTSNFYNESNLDTAGVKLIEIVPFDLGIITSGLRCELYVEKGIGVSKTSKDVERALDSLAEKILEIGGKR